MSAGYPAKPMDLSSCGGSTAAFCLFPCALPRRKASQPNPMPIIAAVGIPTPSPIFADEGSAEELSDDDVDEVDGRPDTAAVVAGPGLDEELGIDATLVAAVKALVETLLVVESADEILKYTVRSLEVVAPVTKSIIMNTGEVERSFAVATIQLRVFRLKACPSVLINSCQRAPRPSLCGRNRMGSASDLPATYSKSPNVSGTASVGRLVLKSIWYKATVAS